MSDTVTFIFPAKAEYIGAIRLAASGVACGRDFDVGKIEDIKSCVAEACLLLMCTQTCSALHIHLECGVTIKVRVCAGEPVCAAPVRECQEFNQEMSKIMIEALAETVSFVRRDDVMSEVQFVIGPDAEE